MFIFFKDEDEDEDGDDFDTPSVEDTLEQIDKDKEGDDDEDKDKGTEDASEDEDTSDDDEEGADDDADSDDEEDEESGADEEEDDDESDSDDDTDEDEDEESDEDSEDSDKESDDDDESDEDAEDEAAKGKQTIPMVKFLKRGDKIRDLKKELKIAIKAKDDAKGKKSEAEFEATLTQLAKETGADPKFVKGFAKAILEKTSVPESVSTGLKVLTDNAEKVNQKDHATSAWKKEILPLFNKEYPDTTPKMRRKAEELFIEKALNPEHFGIKKLPMLYKGDDSFRTIFKKKGKKSGETMGGKKGKVGRSKGKKDLTDPEAPQKWDLSPKEHDEYTENMVEQQDAPTSKLIRRKDNIIH